MGKRNKLKRFEDLKNFSNVYDGDLELPESWKNFVMDISGDLVLELGCGKGTYTTALAQIFPEYNYIGIDRKGERLWVGAKFAKTHNLENVLFLRGDVKDLPKYFEECTVYEIWITFPDPFPRKKQAKHRLTSPEFLKIYEKVLVPGGLLHLKTDDLDLFEYSLETIQKSGGKILKALANIYQEENLDPVLLIQTDFEKKHLAKEKKIYYLVARL